MHARNPELPATAIAALPALPPDVFVVCWPSESARRRYLEEAGLPRLLLVEPGSIPPSTSDCLEDWVLLTASTEEIIARASTLKARAGAHEQPRPVLERNGIVTYGTRLTTVATSDAGVLDALLPRFGEPVAAQCLLDELSAASPVGPNPIDVAELHGVIGRLRAELAPLGLSIAPVGDLGYCLGVDPLGPRDLFVPREAVAAARTSE